MAEVEEAWLLKEDSIKGDHVPDQVLDGSDLRHQVGGRSGRTRTTTFTESSIGKCLGDDQEPEEPGFR